MTYLRTKFHVSRFSVSMLTVTERKAEENLSAIDIFVILHFTKNNYLNKVAYYLYALLICIPV